MTRPRPRSHTNKIIYFVRFDNVSRPPGFAAHTCPAHELGKHLQAYTQKIMERQLRQPFKTVNELVLIHTIDNPNGSLGYYRERWMKNQTFCPACGEDFLEHAGALNSAASPDCRTHPPRTSDKYCWSRPKAKP